MVAFFVKDPQFCPVCGSEEIVYRRKARNFRYVHLYLQLADSNVSRGNGIKKYREGCILYRERGDTNFVSVRQEGFDMQ